MSSRYRRGLANRHYQIFLVALGVMLVHLLEDTFVHEESGETVGAKLGAAALTLLLVGVGAALYPILWRRVRPFFVLLFGLIALVGGLQAHVSNALDDGPSGGDYTGTLYALAGLVLVGLAVKLAADSLRGRAAPAAG